jgi:CYTH domain-containing protein
MVEVEFDSEQASREFLPPDFAQFEVTADAAYQDQNLARFGLPDDLVDRQTAFPSSY